MGVRLRYLGHELEVPEGEFVIGRSSKCQLSLDDPMVSRQHAVLIVRSGRAIVDDLGSRNGVLVNGTRVKGTQRLVEGDKLTIGSQDMVITGLSNAPPSREIGAAVTQRFELHETISGLEEEPNESESTVHGPSAKQIAADPSKRVHELSLVGAVAQKAIALGRHEDAARLLERPVRDMVDRCRKVVAGDASARPVEPAAAERAAELMLHLGAALGQAAWIHLAVDIYEARREVPPQTIVDRLYEAVGKVPIDVDKLHAYVVAIAPVVEHGGPTAKFLYSRLEGLERLARSK
jgi:pSer/pThr/pTyr-binding forkhead associated (FHA) protein